MQKKLSWRESTGARMQSAPYQPAPGHCTLLKNTPLELSKTENREFDLLNIGPIGLSKFLLQEYYFYDQ